MLHAHNIILRYWYAQFEWLVLKHDQCTWAGGFMLSIHCSPPLLSILCRLVAARPEVRSHWRKEDLFGWHSLERKQGQCWKTWLKTPQNRIWIRPSRKRNCSLPIFVSAWWVCPVARRTSPSVFCCAPSFCLHPNKQIIANCKQNTLEIWVTYPLRARWILSFLAEWTVYEHGSWTLDLSVVEWACSIQDLFVLKNICVCVPIILCCSTPSMETQFLTTIKE